jgi:hypothetical protein
MIILLFQDITQRRMAARIDVSGQPIDALFKGQVPSLGSSTLRMGQIVCPETSIRNYHYNLRNIALESRYHLHNGVSLISRTLCHVS